MGQTLQDSLQSALDWAKDVNLTDHLVYRHLREGRGDSVALLYQDTQLTYAQVSDRVSRAATFLDQNDIEAGDSILLLLPDTPAFAVAFFGSLHVGAIAVPLNPALAAKDVADIAVRVNAKLAFVEELLLGKFERLAENNVRLVAVGDGCSRKAKFEEQLDSTDASSIEPYCKAGAIGYCLFSSGTTGAPKGIPHRHTDILECIKAYSLPILNMSASDCVLAVPKLTFGYGLGGNLLSSFYAGGSAILIPEPSSAESIAEAATRYQPTLFLGQPRLIAGLLQKPVPEAFHRLRLAVTAGEVLVPALYERWRDMLDVELLDGFGSTEVGHVFISNSVGDVRPGCAGRVLPGFDVKILDDAGHAVPSNTVGHLWVRGPSLASEYWNDPERTRQHFRQGWARTGDLFRCDEEGYLYACGRADDMIKAGCGQWVSPTEIESVLQEDSSVTDCAVVGFSDEFGVVRPKAYVELKPGQRPSVEIEERLKQLVVERWPELVHKHLGAIEFVSALPRSTTGKLQRFRLRPATLTEFSYEC